MSLQTFLNEVNKNHMTREFDSCIFKKHLAGRIKPAFFVLTFLFLGMLFYVIV